MGFEIRAVVNTAIVSWRIIVMSVSVFVVWHHQQIHDSFVLN